MKVAVSGASGLVGSHLVRRLESLGHEVAILDRVKDSTSSGKRRETPTDASAQRRALAWRPKQGLEDPGVFNELDAVVHLAGKPIADGRWNAEVKKEIRESRTIPTRRLAEQMADAARPPRAWISASAVGYYGDCGDRIVTESDPPAADFLGSTCVEWESACNPAREAGIRVFHPRLGIVQHPSGGALAKLIPLFKSFLGGPVGSGQQYFPWIGLEDVVGGILWALEREDASGAYNFTSPNPVRNREFVQTLGEVLARPAVVPAPAFALRLALGEMADALLLSSCRAVPNRLEEDGYSFQFPDLEACLRSMLKN